MTLLILMGLLNGVAVSLSRTLNGRLASARGAMTASLANHLLGFGLLGLQAISELIKRFAFLQGKGPNPLLHGAHESNEAHDAEHAHPHPDNAGEVRK